MERLKQRILEDGKALGTDVVKVDSFLNHQIDVQLLEEIGEEFARRFQSIGANKILTVEASGIAIACAAALKMGGIPVVFAKKTAPSTMVDGSFETEVTSFTKRSVSKVIVSKEFLGEGDNVLILDDFLAHGEAALGLLELCRQAGAKAVGVGAVVEKQYQGGAKRIRELGYPVESLAVISSIKDGNIQFAN